MRFVRAGFIAVTFVCSSFLVSAATFDYSYTFSKGDVVTGSFDGVLNADGNTVSGLTGISALFNGVALNGSGNLYAASYTGAGFVSGSAVASMDGTANNFFFSDVDFPNNLAFSSFFTLLPLGAVSTNYAEVGDASDSFALDFGRPDLELGAYNPSRWTLTAVSAVPEVETGLTMLVGLGLMGMLARRRKINLSVA